MTDLVIFDMDGLLFDSERLFMNILIQEAKKRGYVFTEELYKKTIGMNGENLKKIVLEEMGEDYPFYEVSNNTNIRMKEYALEHGIPVKEGVYDILEYLKNKEIKCCVASSTKTDTVRFYLKKANIDTYFEFIIGGDRVNKSKPDSEIFINACEYFSVECKNALVLEDSKNGIIAAYSADIPVICVPDMIEPDEEMKNMTRKICSNLREVAEYLADVQS